MKAKKSLWVKFALVVALAAFMVTGAGCGKAAKKIAIGSFGGPVVLDLLNTLLDSPNARLLKEAMPSNILLVTAAAEMGQSRELYEVCAFLYTSYGMMIEDDDAIYAIQLYNIGKKYGIRGLCTNPAFAKGWDEGKKIPELVGNLDQRYVMGLTWTGLATGLIIIHQMDDPMALMGLPDAVSLVKRSVELNQNYFFGVGKAFLGAYYALMPAFLGLGGGPEASAEMFDEARAITDGKFLMVDVFQARYLSTYIDDRPGFEKLLNHVLEANSADLKGGEALNDLAKIKARYFLSIEDELF
ncbi:MAG: TRAP transporter TatT component family protein [Thermodesulfobacteriota bacterium]